LQPLLQKLDLFFYRQATPIAPHHLSPSVHIVQRNIRVERRPFILRSMPLDHQQPQFLRYVLTPHPIPILRQLYLARSISDVKSLLLPRLPICKYDPDTSPSTALDTFCFCHSTITLRLRCAHSENRNWHCTNSLNTAWLSNPRSATKIPFSPLTPTTVLAAHRTSLFSLS
jgi:hypothetical protein